MTRAQAYRRTLYRAGEVVVRVGRRSVAADRWLARNGAREAAFITAWNPMSRVMPLLWNHAAQARLCRDLRGRPMALGEGALGRWREDMLLVAADARRIMRAALRFRQAAIVTIRRGQPARLRFTPRLA